MITYLFIVDSLWIYRHTSLSIFRIGCILVFTCIRSCLHHDIGILAKDLLFDLVPLGFFHFVIRVKLEEIQVVFSL